MQIWIPSSCASTISLENRRRSLTSASSPISRVSIATWPEHSIGTAMRCDAVPVTVNSVASGSSSRFFVSSARVAYRSIHQISCGPKHSRPTLHGCNVPTSRSTRRRAITARLFAFWMNSAGHVQACLAISWFRVGSFPELDLPPEVGCGEDEQWQDCDCHEPQYARALPC
jgi:hypothetical protein